MNSYQHKLNEILDQIWSSTNLSDEQLAKKSGLCLQTVQRIGSRETRFPHFRTVIMLAKAVGFELTLVPAKSGRKIA